MMLRSAAFAAAIIAAATVAANAQTKQGFDGDWRIQLVTEQGWCGVHNWQIGVSGGRVTNVGAPGATANGRIDRNGRVALQIARGSDVLQSVGTVSDKAGGGAWSLPSRSCAGRWVAARI